MLVVLYSENLESNMENLIYSEIRRVAKNNKDRVYLENELKKYIYEPFEDFRENFIEKLADYICIQEELGLGYTTSLLKLTQNCEVYWDFKNSLTFYCDLSKNKFTSDKVDKVKLKDLLEKLQNVCNKDCIVINAQKEGKDPFVLRLSKSYFNMGLQKDGETHSNYCLTLSVYDKEKRQDKSVSFYIVPELYPKMFIDNSYIGTVNTVNIKGISDYCKSVKMVLQSIKQDELKDTVSDSFRIFPYGVRNNESVIQDLYDDTGFTVEPFIHICMYCLDKYVNRKRIYKKLDEVKEHGVSARVSLPKDGKEGSVGVVTKFVNVRDIVVYEKKHKVSLGGHHASPREHQRCGYWRQYKSGKRVWINATTVNAGVKKKTVYKVN